MESSTLPQKELNPARPVSTGLPAWMGIFGVLVFALAALGVARTSSLPLESIPGKWPGINLVAVAAIALVAGVFFTLSFSAIGALVRRPAADYVLASRLINAPLAFASSWTFLIAISLFAGKIAGSLANQIIPYWFNTLGTVFGFQELLSMAGSSATPQAAIVIGTVVVVIAFLIMTMPPKTISAMLRAGFIVLLISWLVLLVQLAISNGLTFTANYDKVFGSNAFATHVEQAYQYGMETDAPSTGSVLLVGLFSGFYLFFGSSLSAQTASEVRKPGKSIIFGSLGAVLITGALLLAVFAVLQEAVPPQFLAAQSYLAQMNIEVTGSTMPWIPFYAAITQPTLGFSLVIGISWIYLIFLVVQALMFVVSRVVLAWSRDKIIPERIGAIPARQQTPVLAVLIAAITVQFGLIDAVQGGLVNSWMHLAVFISFSQLLPVAALALSPILGKGNKDLLKVGSSTLAPVSVVALLTLVYLVWMIFAAFTSAVQIQPVSWQTLRLLLICMMSGLAWYLGRWYLLRRQGISLRDAFRSLPPEE